MADAQVPPAPEPPESLLQKDALQLFSDLTAHRAKIEQAEVDDETIRLQDDILATWDRLLDQAKAPKPKPQPNQNQSSQSEPNAEPNPQQQPGESPSQPKGGDPQQNNQPGQEPGDPDGQQDPTGTGDSPGQSTGESTNQPADQADAEARLREEQNRFAQLKQDERERLMKEVWGKLPLRIRQKLLNASDEKYLPEYEDRIQEYFRKLSTPESRTRGE
jgi:hypothetical protein